MIVPTPAYLTSTGSNNLTVQLLVDMHGNLASISLESCCIHVNATLSLEGQQDT